MTARRSHEPPNPRARDHKLRRAELRRGLGCPWLTMASGQGYRDVQPHLPDNKMERDLIAAIEGHEDDEGKPMSTIMSVAEDGPEQVTFAPRKYNTGPKGVIEDARQARAKAQLQRQADAALRAEQMRSKHGGVPRIDAAEFEDEEEEEAEEEEAEDGDDAFRKYRQQRLQQLQRGAQVRSYLPTFGELKDLSIDGYLACVEGGHPETFVVVHLYEPHLPACVRLNFRLQELADKFDQVCFGSMVASEAKEGMGTADLPALVAYRGGEYLESELRVHETIGDELPLAALQDLVQGLGVELSAASVMSAADGRAALRRGQETLSDEGSDDED
jgi:hypothetical protein